MVNVNNWFKYIKGVKKVEFIMTRVLVMCKETRKSVSFKKAALELTEKN